jgi:hypothetical protein
MSKTITANQTFRKRLNHQHTLTTEQIEQEQAELSRFRHRCQPIFEQIKPQFMETHYNWYVAIEPDSGDYFLGESDLKAGEKAHEKYPNARIHVFRINETGVCGTI